MYHDIYNNIMIHILSSPNLFPISSHSSGNSPCSCDKLQYIIIINNNNNNYNNFVIFCFITKETILETKQNKYTSNHHIGHC